MITKVYDSRLVHYYDEKNKIEIYRYRTLFLGFFTHYTYLLIVTIDGKPVICARSKFYHAIYYMLKEHMNYD